MFAPDAISVSAVWEWLVTAGVDESLLSQSHNKQVCKEREVPGRGS